MRIINENLSSVNTDGGWIVEKVEYIPEQQKVIVKVSMREKKSIFKRLGA